ncbi:MAG: rRNA ((1402)-N(4))-methyltransferase, partial [Myxococcales bacterium]|nr:rRNA ((1402)-N(4))-methyltransferase [Myxococcales bacterium]
MTEEMETLKSDSAPLHQPVLLDEVLEVLQPRPGGVYCDATVGMGGHSRAILERSSPDGRLIGIDRDRDAITEARATLEMFGDRV